MVLWGKEEKLLLSRNFKVCQLKYKILGDMYTCFGLKIHYPIPTFLQIAIVLLTLNDADFNTEVCAIDFFL